MTQDSWEKKITAELKAAIPQIAMSGPASVGSNVTIGMSGNSRKDSVDNSSGHTYEIRVCTIFIIQ